MLVWRDLPDPSQQAFVQDVKHYAKAGIIGINTETRNAIATTFTNLYFRGQLMWNPNADVPAMTKAFYKDFYGPAAGPAGKYWDAIINAFGKTVVTEHEFMAAPGIYTPALMSELAKDMAAANAAIAPLEQKANLDRNEKLYVQRVVMLRKQWAVLDGYMKMVGAAATDADYAKAAQIGREAMKARLDLAAMNPTFTTQVIGPGEEPRQPGGDAAWFPGEVQQYIDLLAMTDGTKGTLIAKLPLEWAFHRDPNDTGLARGWAYKPADLTFWNAHKAKYNIYTRKDYPTTEWEMLRTDRYAQAQGIRHPDCQAFAGYFWYKTTVKLAQADVASNINLRFPGLFDECWLYANGKLVAHRDGYQTMWWNNDYKFEWDVNLAGALRAGDNDITLRCANPHHFGGMFRRPFLYKPVK